MFGIKKKKTDNINNLENETNQSIDKIENTNKTANINKEKNEEKKGLFSFLKKKEKDENINQKIETELDEEIEEFKEEKDNEVSLEKEYYLKDQENLTKIEEKINEISKIDEKINLLKTQEDEKIKLQNKKIESQINEIDEINKNVENLKESLNKKTTENENIEIDELKKSKKGFFSNIFNSFSQNVNEENFDDLFFDIEIQLLEKNVAIDVIEEIKNRILEQLNDIKKGDFKKQLKNLIKEILYEIIQDPIDLIKETKSKEKPQKILFLGVNGVGKTTTLAKLIYKLKEEKQKCVISASDTFRAAAIDQLETLANRLETKIIKHDYGADPASVAYDAIEHAKKNNVDYVLIDSAGRLHNNKNLMRELEKIYRINNIDHVIFVGDCVSGNDLIEQAQEFSKSVPIDSIILTKTDSDKALGSIISVSYAIKKPIIYLGVGQELKDLSFFNKEEFIENLFE
ncbi:MAG: signal recognition particle-docking protein FtsY [Candidatus Nanoarchaeia archaeon]|nr:signal recognition particle-docking protein FtsY [Candidatus Nanoarchaeia archaeon]